MAETPSSYKRFAQSDKISQGITNAALSLNDYLPGQHVTGPNNNDIAATLAQVQAIPIGTATLSGNTYNVTISNYPNTATIYPGQKISVKFNADAPTADDTALNLSAFGQSLPLCARGVRMGQGAIKSGMILELVYRGDMWNADYDVVKANRDANGYTTFADGQSGYSRSQVNNALANYAEKKANFYRDDFNLKYLSGSTFMQKYYKSVFTGTIFYALEMIAIEELTGRYVRVLYKCKKDISATYLIKEEGGLSANSHNVYGTVIISGLQESTTKIIQLTRLITYVPNGTYYS